MVIIVLLLEGKMGPPGSPGPSGPPGKSNLIFILQLYYNCHCVIIALISKIFEVCLA